MMPNKNEQRLYQIEILLRAHRGDNNGVGHEDEIQALLEERKALLEHMNYMG